MIMALIYRNVPRKKTNELLLLGERISAEEAREAGIVNRVVPAEEFDAAVDEWARKLASKSPVLMRLGKDAMYRQLDMPLRGRARLPALPALDRLHHRGHPGGREGLLREARAELDGPLSVGVSLVALRCRTSDRSPGRAARRGDARAAGGRAPGRGAALRSAAPASRARRAYDEDLRESRGCLLEAGGQIDDALAARQRAVLLAADCSVSRHHAARRAAPPPGRAVLWLDAHGDYNTPDTTAQRLPRRHVPGRRLRRVGRRARRHGAARARRARRRPRPRPGRARAARAQRRRR